MADSFDKRQRAQRKAKKRRDKLARRVQRNADKRSGTIRSTAGFHTFRRGDTEHIADADLWLSVLDIAAHRGWTPLADTRELPASAGSYARPRGLTIAGQDAQTLAESIEAELPRIPDEEWPLSDQPFGEAHTDELIALRIDGLHVEDVDIQAAREILSGPTKKAAERLAEFLRGGSFSVDG